MATDEFPRPPRDDEERAACKAVAMLGGGGFCFSLGPGIFGLQVRAVCNRIPRHSGDHIDASEDGLIVCRWPSAPRHDAGTGDHPAPTCECGARLNLKGQTKCADCIDRMIASPPPSPGGEDGTVGRFLAFAACQSDDTDRAICDAFYRAFVRLEQQLDDTQRRLQATEDARQRVCFARDRALERIAKVDDATRRYQNGGSDAHTTIQRIADGSTDPYVDSLPRCPECGSSNYNGTEAVCLACSNRARSDG